MTARSPDAHHQNTYTPIDCGFHDQLEDFAVRRIQVDVVLVPDDGDAPGLNSMSGLISDVFARDGADWMVLRTASGAMTIRLDEIRSVNGIPLPSDVACRTD